MTDFPIALPPDKGLIHLLVSPNFDKLSDIAQRAVVILMCRNDDRLTVRGTPLWEILPQCTLAGVPTVISELGGVASAIKDYLNGHEDDPDVPGTIVSDEDFVDNVEFSFTRVGDIGEVSLDIRTHTGNTESIGVYAYV